MLKKVTLFTLAFLVALSLLIPVNALAETQKINGTDSVMSPQWTYINYVTNSLTINSSGKASMMSTINTYSATQVCMFNYLQRYQNGTWSAIQSWYSTTQGKFGVWTDSYYVYSGYNYRLLTYYYVYNGSSIVESTTLTSPTSYY
jgi:hypothetical protein